MTTAEVIAACDRHVHEFERVTAGVGFESKGIFNSEMLMFVSIARELGARQVIETGRARGQSTTVLSRFFPEDIQIDSVELSRYTRDSVIALRRLRGRANLTLHFGDARTVVPGLIRRDCCVLIDGPKGDAALALAVDLLKQRQVLAVALHDVHRDSHHRAAVEEIFRHTAFSDDEEFVRRFERLDEVCWREQARATPGWGPYRRGTLRMRSYAATLAVAFANGNAIDEAACERYFSAVAPPARLRTRLLRRVRAGLRRSAAPLWFVPYHVERSRR
jgi:predicted O-methyltransferase YrrM